eukprot:6683225-Prymnesium_polylepis.1
MSPSMRRSYSVAEHAPSQADAPGVGVAAAGTAAAAAARRPPPQQLPTPVSRVQPEWRPSSHLPRQPPPVAEALGRALPGLERGLPLD